MIKNKEQQRKMKHFLLSEKEESFVAKRLLVKVNEADNVAIQWKKSKPEHRFQKIWLPAVSEDLLQSFFHTPYHQQMVVSEAPT